MSFYKKAILSTCLLSLTACTTLSESMRLGAGVGALTGIATVTTASNLAEKNVSEDQKLHAASVGIALGLLTSFLLHKNIEEKRESFFQSGPEIHFGDLPPSPFIMTPNRKKKGGK
jgi:hypothetical protein